jgi:hypothetical protein
MGFVNTAPSFDEFGRKFENFIAARYPQTLDSGKIRDISVGRNMDAAVGKASPWRVNGDAVKRAGVYAETIQRKIPSERIANEDAKLRGDCWDGINGETIDGSDDAKKFYVKHVADGVKAGKTPEEALASVRVYGYNDKSTGKICYTPIKKKAISDSVLTGLQIPFWNVSYINKIYKQPFIKSFAKNLVSQVGVPNPWADVITLFTESFEGYARLSSVAKTTGEANTSSPVMNSANQIVSDLVNIVVDYDIGINEQKTAALNGNFLGGTLITDREQYARMMGERLYEALILFGNPESGFNGLSQLADSTGGTVTYAGEPASELWANAIAGTETAAGSRLMLAFNAIIGDLLEANSYLPTSVKINVSAALYKALHLLPYSQEFNPSSPLATFGENMSNARIVGRFDKIGLNYEICCDPLCAANTPWNNTDLDLMFITFPAIEGENGVQDDLVMAPVAFENYVLPQLYAREGMLYTNIKRVGSLISPIQGVVNIIKGFGQQPA